MLLFALPVVAAAQSPAEVLAQHRIELHPSADAWTPEEVTALAEGVSSLPEPLRVFPGEPLKLERVREPGPFGMGDGSKERPEWRDGRFVVYDFTEPEGEERARFRTVALDPSQRESLWRRRALVHAVMKRWDDDRRFSNRDGWRVISGWTETIFGGTRGPLNLYGWAFSRERGRVNAALDFLTFAEELFVDPNALKPGAVPVDDTLRCQEMTRARFFATVLRELGTELPPRGACPLFDAWSMPEDVERFDILLAEPSAVHPESVFGHMLMQPIRKKARPPSSQEVFEIAAVVDGSDGAAAFVIKGALGGYQSTFGRSTMTQLRHRYLELDQRTLRRFQLHLTPPERERVMERMWELERRGYLPYYFASDNCASLLLFLLAPAIGSEAAAFRFPWAMPTVVLDELARTRREVTLDDGSVVKVPLLTLEPEHEPADIEEAFRADRQRPHTLRGLRALLDEAGTDALDEWLAQAEASDPALRERAYNGLGELVTGALSRASAADREAQRALWSRLVDEQVLIERYAADRARRAVAAVHDARIIRERVKPPSAQDLLDFRKKLFRTEDPARPRIELRQVIELEWLWSTAPRRPATRKEEATLAHSKVVHDAFRLLAASSASLRANGTLPPPAKPVVPDRTEWLRAQSRPGTRASGHARLVAQPTALWFGDGIGFSPGLKLRLAFLGEHLGDQRDRGFGPRNEVRALDFSAILGWDNRQPTVTWADLVLFRFRTTTRQPELMRTGLFSATGQGAGLEYRRRQHALWRDVLELQGALYLPLAGYDGTEGRLWAVGVGTTGQLRFQHGRRSVGVGPRFEWLSRLPLGRRSGSAVRLEAVYGPIWSRRNPLEHQAAGNLLLEMPFRLFGRDVIFAPTVGVELEHRTDDTRLRGNAGIGFEAL